MLLDVVGCCWMLLDVVGCCWMLLDVVRCTISLYQYCCADTVVTIVPILLYQDCYTNTVGTNTVGTNTVGTNTVVPILLCRYCCTKTVVLCLSTVD
jgi:hypothetical protein